MMCDIETRLSSLEAQYEALTGKLTGTEICIARYGNTNSAELVTQVPITKTSPYTFVRLMGVRTGQIKAGDSFQVLSEFQVSSSYAYNCMLGTIIRANTTTAYGGSEVTEANGQNFRGDEEHHFVRVKVGEWVATADYDSLYFNLFVYAASSAASSGHKLTVDQDYGRLIVRHFRRFEDL